MNQPRRNVRTTPALRSDKHLASTTSRGRAADRFWHREAPVEHVWPSSSEELFGREPFTSGPDLRYYGTGSPGRGGPGFTGGYYGYGDEPPDMLTELEREYVNDLYGVGTGDAAHPLGARYELTAGPGYAAPAALGPGRLQTPSRRMRKFPPGPKGYRRSDERLREDICERVMRAGPIDSSEVTIAVTDAKVMLEGTVPERWMKHAIEDLADACPGVHDIENRIRVQKPATPSGEAQLRSP